MVIKMKRTKKATKGEAVFLLVAGLIIGTVFTFGVRYWNVPITEDNLSRQHFHLIKIVETGEEI